MRLCLNVFKLKLTVNSFFPTNLHKKVPDPARGLIGTAFALPLNRGKCWGGGAQWERGLRELSSPGQGGTQSLP